MDTIIDVLILNIGRDSYGNRMGRFAAWRDGAVIAESGRRRHQIHGSYASAAQAWLATRGIATDASGGKMSWSSENARGRVTDVRLTLPELA